MKKLIIAHRGASACERENTIPAFSKAIEQGADMIEFDVRRTADQVYVVFHDPALDEKLLRDTTYSELNSLAAQKGFSIPTVEETIRYIRGKIRADIELKEPGYENEIISLVRSYLDTDDFIITSFNPAILTTVKESYPEIKLGFLLDDTPYNRSLITDEPSGGKLSAMIRDISPDFILPHVNLFSPVFCRIVEELNMPVIVWTVNDRAKMSELLHHNAIGAVITDTPDSAVCLRAELV